MRRLTTSDATDTGEKTFDIGRCVESVYPNPQSSGIAADNHVVALQLSQNLSTSGRDQPHDVAGLIDSLCFDSELIQPGPNCPGEAERVGLNLIQVQSQEQVECGIATDPG